MIVDSYVFFIGFHFFLVKWPSQSWSGTRTCPCSSPVNIDWLIFFDAGVLMIFTTSARQLALSTLTFIFEHPKAQSQANLVWPTGQKDEVIFVFKTW